MNTKVLFVLLAFISLLMYRYPYLVGVICGVCLFLYGMTLFDVSFKLFTGMEAFLKRMTQTRPGSLVFGIVTTAMVQSSTLVSVLTISFLSAGLMTLTSGLAVLYGSNLGSVASVWLVAALGIKIDIAQYAMPIMVIGLCCLVGRAQAVKGMGYFLFGIGLIFFGIAYIKSGFEGLQSSVDIARYAMGGVKGLLLYTALGVVVTIIMQSSAAVLALVVAALSVQQLAYDNAVAIAIGANVGSTLTAILGAANANAEGKKLGAAHVLFNCVTALLALVGIRAFLWMTDTVAAVAGVRHDDYIVKLAIFHTLFNVTGILVFYPWIGATEKLLNRFIQDKTERSKVSRAHYLSDEALQHTSSALKVLLEEVKHLYGNTSSIMAKSIGLSKSRVDSEVSSKELIASHATPLKIDFDELYQNRFKELYGQIVDFTARAIAMAPEAEVGKFMDVRRAALLLAEALKNMKNTQANMYRFMDADNAYIKYEYDKLRLKVIRSLRLVHRILHAGEAGEPPDLNRLIKDLRKIYSQFGDDASGMNSLLVQKKITSAMATSLMNDTAQIQSLAERLLQVAELVARHAGHIDWNVLKSSLGAEDEAGVLVEQEA